MTSTFPVERCWELNCDYQNESGIIHILTYKSVGMHFMVHKQNIFQKFIMDLGYTYLQFSI